jgi:hypothetical protein
VNPAGVSTQKTVHFEAWPQPHHSLRRLTATRGPPASGVAITLAGSRDTQCLSIRVDSGVKEQPHDLRVIIDRDGRKLTNPASRFEVFRGSTPAAGARPRRDRLAARSKVDPSDRSRRLHRAPLTRLFGAEAEHVARSIKCGGIHQPFQDKASRPSRWRAAPQLHRGPSPRGARSPQSAR